MNEERKDVAETQSEMMDRRVIRVDFPLTHAGITAALRRAFSEAAAEPSEHDFTDLLRRLN